MPDLITIVNKLIGHKTVAAVSARQLHERLGVRRDFSTWFSQHTKGDDWRNGNDYSVFNLEGENPHGGRPPMDAALSIQMAEHIAMLTRTTKGREVREYFRKSRDERDALVSKSLPQVKNPAHQLLIDTVVRLDEVEQRALCAERAAQAADLRAERAEGKADMLLDAHRMTVQEFVLKNGLLHQFPETQWSAISRWIRTFCEQYSLAFVPVPVVGQRWTDENNYPIQAIMAWLRHEQRKPQQITLVPHTQKGG